MYTSSFFSPGIRSNPHVVCISRGKPDWFNGRVYEPLMPQYWMLKLREPDFSVTYHQKILIHLNAIRVAQELGNESILLCWEPFNVRCHRRIVAEWLEKSLGMVIPEYGKERECCLPYKNLPEKKSAQKKETPPRLF